VSKANISHTLYATAGNMKSHVASNMTSRGFLSSSWGFLFKLYW